MLKNNKYSLLPLSLKFSLLLLCILPWHLALAFCIFHSLLSSLPLPFPFPLLSFSPFPFSFFHSPLPPLSRLFQFPDFLPDFIRPHIVTHIFSRFYLMLKNTPFGPFPFSASESLLPPETNGKVQPKKRTKRSNRKTAPQNSKGKKGL